MRINGKEFEGYVIDHGNDIEPLVALLVDSGAATYDDDTGNLTFVNYNESRKTVTADPARMEE